MEHLLTTQFGLDCAHANFKSQRHIGTELGASGLTDNSGAFTFTGSVGSGNDHGGHFYAVSGTYSNTAAGITLDGQYSTGGSVVTFRQSAAGRTES